MMTTARDNGPSEFGTVLGETPRSIRGELVRRMCARRPDNSSSTRARETNRNLGGNGNQLKCQHSIRKGQNA
eukprot:scaffold14838_cov45-Attheya_sp.AAC.3